MGRCYAAHTKVFAMVCMTEWATWLLLSLVAGQRKGTYICHATGNTEHLCVDVTVTLSIDRGHFMAY